MSPHSRNSSNPQPADDLEFHRLLRRSAEPGILVLSAEGRLISHNAVAGVLFGWGEEGARYKTGELPEVLAECLRGVRTEVSGKVERTLSLEDEGGSPSRFLWVNAFRFGEPGTEPCGFLVTLHDLSVARDLEVQTARLQQLANVGMLSAGVAHEVKNALVAVKTYAELLLEKQPDSESAGLVRREVGRIDSLIGQLLQLAAPLQPVTARVALHEVLNHALRLVHHALQERKIEEVFLLEASSDLVWGDSKQLEQAFLNLLFNAIEAMEDGGRLVVRSEVVVATEHISKFDPGRRQQQLQVEIRDTGGGVAPAMLDRLFAPFVTSKPSGTGLGLAITQRIVKEHRGRIHVESRTGEGTMFRVILPLWKPK